MTAPQEQYERRVRELEAIAHIAASFTFEQSLQSMMGEVARQVVQANGASTGCCVGAGDPETQLISRVLGSFAVPPGFEALVERTWRSAGTPLVSSSLQMRKTQVLVLAEVLQRAGYEEVREAQRRAGWTTMAVVPMVYREQALGLVFVFYPGGYVPDGDEIRFLEAMANQAAIAMENARLFDQAQAAAIDEERQRLSRELHDSVSQSLYAISLTAQAARKAIDRNPAKAADPIEYIVSLSHEALSEMRALIFDLRPEVLETEGLVAALERQFAILESRSQVTVVRENVSEPSLGFRGKEAAYRVARESLQNVAKHSGASKVKVRFEQVDGEFRLTISDNGRGFHAGAEFPGHLGLVSMRERAAREGGSVTIESAPGAGSTVRLTLPLA